MHRPPNSTRRRFLGLAGGAAVLGAVPVVTVRPAEATPAKEYWKPAFFLGLIDLESDKAAPAATSLRRATELFPDQPVAHYYLAQAEEKAPDAPRPRPITTKEPRSTRPSPMPARYGFM